MVDGGVLIKSHHIIMDGWSQVLLCNRIAETYLALLSGKDPQPEPSPDYKLHIDKELQYLDSAGCRADERYWRGLLETPAEPVSFKEQRGASVSPVGRRLTYTLPETLNHAIYTFCQSRRVSPFSPYYMALAIAARRMAKLIRDNAVTTVQITPSQIRLCLGNEDFRAALKDVRLLILTGEASSAALVGAVSAVTDAALVDLYGPTETTVYASSSTLAPGQPVTIGKPYQNCRLYVLDPAGREVLPTARGELYIAGECLSSGYVGRPELTEKAFVPDPFFPGETMSGEREERDISILALDDDPVMTLTLQSYFQNAGYAVETCNDPEAAVEVVRNGHFDILLLDFLMTPICGDQVVERIRQFNTDLFIILLTGHKSMAPPIKTIRALDIQGYYEKSDRFDQLELLVETCVKSVQQMRTIRSQNEALTEANMPFVFGSEGDHINIADVDFVVESSEPIPTVKSPGATDLDRVIAGNIFPYLRDGITLQLGIGGMIRSYPVKMTETLAADPNSDLNKLQTLLNTREAIASRKSTRIPITGKNIANAYISYYDAERGNYEQITLTPAQAEELYSQAILPDVDSGTLGRIWLMTNGYVTGKAYMGVALDENYTSVVSQYYNMPQGAYVKYVEKSSAAEKAGIAAGDVITKIGDKAVASYSDLTSAVKQYRAGDTAQITVYRSGESKTLSITFDEAKADTTTTTNQSGSNSQSGSSSGATNPYGDFSSLFPGQGSDSSGSGSGYSMFRISPISRCLPTRTTSETLASARCSATTSGPETFVTVPLIYVPSFF